MEYEVIWDGRVDGQGGELLFPRFAAQCVVAPVRERWQPTPRVEILVTADPHYGKGQTVAVAQALQRTPGWLTLRDLAKLTGIDAPSIGSVLSRLVKYRQVEVTPDPIVWHAKGRAGRGYRWKAHSL